MWKLEVGGNGPTNKPPFSHLHNSHSSHPPLSTEKSSINENGPGVGVMVGVSEGRGVSVGGTVGVSVGAVVAVSVGGGVLDGKGVFVGGEVGGIAAAVCAM